MPERSDAEMRGWFEETRFRRFQRRFQRHHWLLLCMWTPLGLLLALAKLALLLFACFFVVLIGFYGGERALRHDGRSNGGHHDGGVYGALVWLVRALTLRRVAEAAGIPPSRGLRNPRGVRAAPRCSARRAWWCGNLQSDAKDAEGGGGERQRSEVAEAVQSGQGGGHASLLVFPKGAAGELRRTVAACADAAGRRERGPVRSARAGIDCADIAREPRH